MILQLPSSPSLPELELGKSVCKEGHFLVFDELVSLLTSDSIVTGNQISSYFIFLHSRLNHLNQLKKRCPAPNVMLPLVVAGSTAPCRAQRGAGLTLEGSDSSRAPSLRPAPGCASVPCSVLMRNGNFTFYI